MDALLGDPPPGEGSPGAMPAGWEEDALADGGVAEAAEELPVPQALSAAPASTVMTRALSALPERTVE
ncbi:hypothetical protein GCM10023196_057060 [Actinoallomurus vinaceus]|uniref:Uncharacterized protein n=1 Tax=Actinoallomurus vinaceus TaxID=1080074 RepID=A0ABP8UFB6_9ACTN